MSKAYGKDPTPENLKRAAEELDGFILTGFQYAALAERIACLIADVQDPWIERCKLQAERLLEQSKLHRKAAQDFAGAAKILNQKLEIANAKALLYDAAIAERDELRARLERS